MTTQTVRTGYSPTALERVLLRAAVALEAAAARRILSRTEVSGRAAHECAAVDRSRDARAMGSLGVLP